MLIRAIKTHIFKEGEDLFTFITSYVKTIPEKSVVIITSKIVSLSEKRSAVACTLEEKEKLIRRESELAIPTKYVWLTVKDGMVMASAGIDESNANGKLLLLPKDSFKTARLIRKKLRKKYRLRYLGVLITDSRTTPLRAGVTGVALGYSGFRGVKDYRGKKDIFGRRFKFSRSNIADSLATSAVLVMGEGSERQPLAIAKKTPVQFCDKIHRKELSIDIEEDIYYPVLSKLTKKTS